MKTIKQLAFAFILAALLGLSPLAHAQQAPFCSPSTQVVNLNDFVSFSAGGGNGTYYWLAANGSPSSGSGQTFGTRFSIPGNRIIVLTSNGQNSICMVQVAGGQVLGVSDVSTGAGDTAVWSAVLGLLAALAAYLALFPKQARSLLKLGKDR